MAIGQLQNVLQHLRKVLAPRVESGTSDWELLERFAVAPDETAFEVLVWRHHRMVLSVASRILSDSNDVEDAFQATFLVLARKARSIRHGGSLSSWLYGVARRVALEASARSSRRPRPALLPVPSCCPEPCDAVIRQEFQGIFDEELDKLPEKYRAPVVLCYLAGLTYEEAGQQLGCSKGTVSTRLTRARELLRMRLAGRGLALSAGSLAAWLCANAASAGTPSSLVVSTIKAATSMATGKTVATAHVSAKVAALTEGVLKAMIITKAKLTLAAALVVSFVAVGLGWLISQVPAQDPPTQAAKKREEQGKDGPVVAQQLATDQERLKGAWKVVEVKYGGEELPEERRGSLRLTFAKDKVEYQTDTYILEGTFKLALQEKRKTLDISLDGRVLRALYRLEGDKLILAVGNPYFDSERPNGFVSDKNEDKSVLTLEPVAIKKDTAPADDGTAKEARMKKARLQYGGNLHRLVLAMHKYIDDHNRFPPAATSDDAGKPLLSWRVALLPYLGEKELYDQFRQDETWDSDHNRKLLPKMPKIYASVGNPPKTAYGTFCQVFVGEGCLFEAGKKIGIKDVADGTVCTLAIIAAAEAVPWTKPADLAYDAAKPLPSLVSGMIEDGLISFAMADGSVYVTTNTIEEKLLRAVITRSGGEVVDLNAFKR